MSCPISKVTPLSTVGVLLTFLSVVKALGDDDGFDNGDYSNWPPSRYSRNQQMRPGSQGPIPEVNQETIERFPDSQQTFQHFPGTQQQSFVGLDEMFRGQSQDPQHLDFYPSPSNQMPQTSFQYFPQQTSQTSGSVPSQSGVNLGSGYNVENTSNELAPFPDELHPSFPSLPHNQNPYSQFDTYASGASGYNSLPETTLNEQHSHDISEETIASGYNTQFGYGTGSHADAGIGYYGGLEQNTELEFEHQALEDAGMDCDLRVGYHTGSDYQAPAYVDQDIGTDLYHHSTPETEDFSELQHEYSGTPIEFQWDPSPSSYSLFPPCSSNQPGDTFVYEPNQDLVAGPSHQHITGSLQNVAESSPRQNVAGTSGQNVAEPSSQPQVASSGNLTCNIFMDDLLPDHGVITDSSGLIILYPDSENKIQVEEGASIRVHCVDSVMNLCQYYEDIYNPSRLDITCLQGILTFSFKSQVFPVWPAQFNCLKVPKLTWRLNPQHSLCAKDYAHYQVGFQFILPDRFVGVYDLCVEGTKEKERTVYTWNIIRNTKARETLLSTDTKCQETRAILRAFPQKSYKWENIINFLQPYFGVKLFEKLTRGHVVLEGRLTPSVDLVYRAEKRATLHYSNTIPMWSNLHAYWNLIEIALNTLAQSRNNPLKVFTGASGQLSFKNDNEENVPLFLYRHRGVYYNPYPRIVWKVIIDTGRNECIAIIGENSPEKFEKKECTPIIPENVNWFPRGVDAGFVYACSCAEFRPDVIPEFQIPSKEVLNVVFRVLSGNEEWTH